MVSTTRISPITVITVVEVVGVIPSGQTSSGCPVGRQISAALASGLSGFPVMTIFFNDGFRRAPVQSALQSHASFQSWKSEAADHSPAKYLSRRVVLHSDEEIRKEYP